MNRITTAQIDNADKGKLQINVTSDINSYPSQRLKYPLLIPAFQDLRLKN